MAIISSTIYLVQMKKPVTRTSRHYLLAKTTWSNLHPKIISNCMVQPLIMLMEFISTIIWILGFTLTIDAMTIRLKGHHWGGKGLSAKQNAVYYRHMLFVRNDTHIKYLRATILCQKNIYLKLCFHFML